MTISAIVLVLLGAAAAVRVLTPIKAPDVLVTVDKVRVDGAKVDSCWPQRDGKLRCAKDAAPDLELRRIPRAGRMRVIAVYPVQPKTGTIVIRRGGETVLSRDWTDRVEYELEPGTYRIEANADYSNGAYSRNVFTFRVA